MNDYNDEEAIRLTAYFLWEQDGKPEGRQEEYWLRARDRHARQRHSDGELQSNGPDERTDESNAQT